MWRLKDTRSYKGVLADIFQVDAVIVFKEVVLFF
jgi:hypothetical protein